MHRAETLTEIRTRLIPLLQKRRDIAWARFRADVPDERTSFVKLIVMPSEPWWSGFEREELAKEIESLLDRWVVIEDERSIHCNLGEELKEKWELLIDRDVVRRLDIEKERSDRWSVISEVQLASESMHSIGGLAEFLQSPAIRKYYFTKFKQILDFATTEQLFGFDAFDEDGWNLVSNAASEAGRIVLEMCCGVISLYGWGAPRSTTDAIRLLVDEDLLESGCGIRLANWLSYALPCTPPQEAVLARMRRLLKIHADDFITFYDTVSRAAAIQEETKDCHPPAESLEFDLSAALAGITNLIEHTNDRTERELLSHIKSNVLKRKLYGPSIEELSAETEGIFKQLPITNILVLQDSLFDRQLPRRIAQALYGDASLVYDIGETLDAARPDRRSDAVWGRSETFVPTGTESLPEFIQSHGRAVVFFQNADRADPRHLSRLAVMADAELRCPNGHRLFVGNTCLIICGRFPIGTPREIDFHGSHCEEAPSVFCQLVEHDARLRSPERLSDRILSRFFVNVNCIWERFLQLVASGYLDEPLVRRSPMTHVEPTSPNKQLLHQVEDLYRLIRVTPEPDKFDFFISYSWTRTASQAHELAKILTSRGYDVFLDKDKIVKPKIPMEELIPELIYEVRSSTAVLLFPIQLKEPITNLVGNEEVELRHGRAIRAPALGGGGTVLSEWSWQTLELLAATHHLVVEKHRAFAVAHEGLDPEFIPRQYRSVEELADACESYLDLRCRQGGRVSGRTKLT